MLKYLEGVLGGSPRAGEQVVGAAGRDRDERVRGRQNPAGGRPHSSGEGQQKQEGVRVADSLRARRSEKEVEINGAGLHPSAQAAVQPLLPLSDAQLSQENRDLLGRARDPAPAYPQPLHALLQRFQHHQELRVQEEGRARVED